MTIEELNKIGETISANPQGLQLMIEQKSSIQRVLANQVTTSEAIDVANNKFNKDVYDKLIRIGQSKMQNIGYSELNLFCIAMAIGTILKELFEDTSFVSGGKLSEITNLL